MESDTESGTERVADSVAVSVAASGTTRDIESDTESNIKFDAESDIESDAESQIERRRHKQCGTCKAKGKNNQMGDMVNHSMLTTENIDHLRELFKDNRAPYDRSDSPIAPSVQSGIFSA